MSCFSFFIFLKKIKFSRIFYLPFKIKMSKKKKNKIKNIFKKNFLVNIY
jgi:hypothetical protein